MDKHVLQFRILATAVILNVLLSCYLVFQINRQTQTEAAIAKSPILAAFRDSAQKEPLELWKLTADEKYRQANSGAQIAMLRDWAESRDPVGFHFLTAVEQKQLLDSLQIQANFKNRM
jgi:hypothetical protein